MSAPHLDPSDQSTPQKLIEIASTPPNAYGQELLRINSFLFRQQVAHLTIAPDLYGTPLLPDTALKILKEPEIYDDFIEEEVLAVNPAIAKVLGRVATLRNEENTRLLRVLRNTVAGQVYRGEYKSTDPIWEEISTRL